MSSFFSGKSKSAASSAASSLKGKDVPPPTHDIFLTPEPGCEPKKRFDYDEGQLKQILELKHVSGCDSGDWAEVWSWEWGERRGVRPRWGLE
jgi:hypothetical protein